MNKPGKPSVFKVTALAALLATTLGAQAAGLGKLTVYSGIGQPLNAELALTATPAELGSLSVKLASHEAFREAGIDYMPALSGLRFSLVKLPDGRAMLKLTTDRPVDEPFLHFLVELNWSAGRMMREYTFLLDPPEMLQAAKAAAVVAPVAPSTTALAASQPAEQKPMPPAGPAAGSPAEPVAAGEYQVRRGDTLGRIAREAKPESVGFDQMLVALFESNRAAFDGNNMNRLRAGRILRVPDADQAARIDPAAARKLIIVQAGEFDAYRRHLAEAARAAPAVGEGAPRQQVSGAIKPQVEAKTPAAVAKDKLEVSHTEPAKTARAIGGSSLEEDLIARDKALREAAERIAQLEKNIESLKRLVEIKSETAARMQQESQAAMQKPGEAKPALPPQTEKPAAEAAAAKPAEPAPAAAAPQPEKKQVAPSPPPAAEPGFVEENPEIVYGGGGLIALLLGYLGYSSWRRKKQAAAGATLLPPPARERREPPAVAVAPAPGEGAEPAEISIQSNFGEGGALTAEEIVDPVAEADVLMAYGRDAQAEEILQEGLRHDPARTAIHMKLLDLYAKQENLARFEAVAAELHERSNGRGAEWDKTLAMARTLGLSGGIFLGAEAAPAAPPEASAAAEQPVAAGVVVAAATPAELPEAAPESGGEAASLDFDLDLGTTSRPAEVAVAAAEPVAAAQVAEEPAGLDFDFDLGAPEAAAPAEASGEQAGAAAETEGAAGFDFDLDLGTTSATAAIAAARAAVVEPAAAEEAAVAAPEAAPAAVARANGLDLDFDLELDSGSSAPAEEPAEELAGTEPAEEQLGPETASLASERISPALADISLDLDEPEPLPAVAQEEASGTESVPDNPEVTTKLELAQAYEEMGDLEGARELLNEVLSEGSAAQQQQARARLDQLNV